MKYTPTTKGTLCIMAILIIIILFSWVEGWPAVGNKCTWDSDCGFNEQCKPVPFHQRDGSSYSGICAPDSW